MNRIIWSFSHRITSTETVKKNNKSLTVLILNDQNVTEQTRTKSHSYQSKACFYTFSQILQKQVLFPYCKNGNVISKPKIYNYLKWQARQNLLAVSQIWNCYSLSEKRRKPMLHSCFTYCSLGNLWGKVSFPRL